MLQIKSRHVDYFNLGYKGHHNLCASVPGHRYPIRLLDKPKTTKTSTNVVSNCFQMARRGQWGRTAPNGANWGRKGTNDAELDRTGLNGAERG